VYNSHSSPLCHNVTLHDYNSVHIHLQLFRDR
jgi:hypothetical protein